MLPFVHALRAARSVPLAELASAVGPDTALVAFSLVQSATGEVADAAAITAAAARHGALTSVRRDGGGLMPVIAGAFDVRRLATRTRAVRAARRGVPDAPPGAGRAAEPGARGWYAGDDPWVAVLRR